MPVPQFVDKVSDSNQEIEANLSTVFHSVRGSKRNWHLHRSEVRCMIREYGYPTILLTLSCAEYENLRYQTTWGKSMMY